MLGRLVVMVVVGRGVGVGEHAEVAKSLVVV